MWSRNDTRGLALRTLIMMILLLVPIYLYTHSPTSNTYHISVSQYTKLCYARDTIQHV